MGILYARVGGQWVPVVPTAPDEVWVGPNPPVDTTTELWVDSDSTPAPVLSARIGGVWTPVSSAGGGGGTGTDEVWIDPSPPGDPNIELWVDSDATLPLSENARWNTAWGVVSKGTFALTNGAAIPASVDTVLGNIQVTIVSGRRYLLKMWMNGWFGASGFTGGFLLFVDGVQLGGYPHKWVGGNYDSAMLEWTFSDPLISAGSHALQVRFRNNSAIAGSTYNDWGFFDLYDVGPINSAVPVPNPIPAWIAPTFQNGWVNFGPTYTQAGYRKIGDEVQLRGLVKSGTLVQPIFTLPVDYRPLSYHHLPVASNDLFGVVRVEPNGQIVPTAGSNAWFALDPIRFSVNS